MTTYTNWAMRAAVVAFTILLAGIILLGGQRQAHATPIVNGVFCFLNGFQTTDVFTVQGGCPSGDQNPPMLTVIKHVDNSAGGSAVASDFTIDVSGTNVSEPSFPGAESPGTTVTLNPGSYTVSEESGGPANYDATFNGDCNSEGSGSIDVNESQTCTITNTYTPPAPTTVTVIASKVVCQNESDLPQWGAGGFGPITATTASDWVAGHSNCALVPGWSFQYGDQTTTDGGDTTVGPVAGYTTFGPTDNTGQTTVQVPMSALDGGTDFHLREVLQSGYIPFTYDAASTTPNGNPVSAQFYCASDALNYDNFDFIKNAVAGQTYYCVAFNAPVPSTPPPASCTIVSDTNTQDTTDGHAAVLVSPINAAWTATSNPIAFDPSAVWVWSENPAINTDVNVTKVFTRTFDIVGTPTSGSIDIGADNGFVLIVNGHQVVDDSAIENNYSASQHFDITSDLVSGENTVEVDVTNFGVADSDGTNNPAGVVFQINLPDNACASSGTTGTLEVDKVIVGGPSVNPDQFSFQVTGSTDGTGSPLPFDPSGTSDMTVSTDQTYSVAEVASSTYTTTYSNSQDENADCNDLTVSNGETTTCTVTNTYNSTPAPATLTIVKDATGGDGTFTFNVATSTEGGGSETTQITTDGGTGSVGPISLDPGSYDVTENTLDGWNPAGVNCIYGDNSVGASIAGGEEITVDSGDTVTCTFSNLAEGATPSDISVSKSADDSTPNIGDTVTYTITASDSGSDALGVVVNDQLPSGLTFVSTSSEDTVGVYDPANGNWTIGDLSSTTPVVLHIKATVNDGQDDGTVITNTATVTQGDTSDDPDNNSGSADVTVTIPSTPNSNTTPSGGGGGGNGPIVGSSGGGGGSPTGQVLGASTSTAPGSCSQYLTAFIRLGANNNSDQVVKLQEFLDQFEGDNLTINGIYDQPTYLAVKAFQQKYATGVLSPWGENAPTGFVYLTTRKEINEIYCNFTVLFPLTPAQLAEIAAYKSGQGAGSQGSSGSGAPANTGNGTPVNNKTGNQGTQNPQSTTTNPGINEVGAAGVTQSGGGFLSGIANFFSHLFHH